MTEAVPIAAVAADVPPPVHLNCWKHHAGWARARIAAATAAGPAAVARLPDELLAVGTRLMDLYVGPLSAADVAARLVDQLRAAGRLDPDPFAEWLLASGGYAVLTLPDDGSRWALRLGTVAGRHVHAHPGRYSPYTLRVQANALRTAVLAHAHARLAGRDPAERDVVNEARRLYLGLPPVAGLTADGGLGEVIEVLRG